MNEEFSLKFYSDSQDQHDNTFMNGVNVENFSNLRWNKRRSYRKIWNSIMKLGNPVYRRHIWTLRLLDLYEINYHQIATWIRKMFCLHNSLDHSIHAVWGFDFIQKYYELLHTYMDLYWIIYKWSWSQFFLSSWCLRQSSKSSNEFWV